MPEEKRVYIFGEPQYMARPGRVVVTYITKPELPGFVLNAGSAERLAGEVGMIVREHGYRPIMNRTPRGANAPLDDESLRVLSLLKA
ncbi:MAG: hypothetical protein HY367_01200 [Candidatus Aenigmarchaeota archaeon]|nr:hypothetical protein [Candidatus Aenigmarchaeota archaeon]